MPTEKKTTQQHLVKANIQLSKELFVIKSSLDVDKVIGLNVDSIQAARPSMAGFFGHTQMQSQRMVLLGIPKVFEHNPNRKLCSITGIFELAKRVTIQDNVAVNRYIEHYGITPSGNWVTDVESAHCKKRKWVKDRIKRIHKVRNMLLAHLQQNASAPQLPSMNEFYELLEYGVRFHEFINDAFLPTTSHDILNDTQVQNSFVQLLDKIGITDPTLEYQQD